MARKASFWPRGEHSPPSLSSVCDRVFARQAAYAPRRLARRMEGRRWMGRKPGIVSLTSPKKLWIEANKGQLSSSQARQHTVLNLQSVPLGGFNMSQANRPNRKASDEDLIKLNSVGLSLGTIANHLGVHPTTVTLRLTGLGVKPADTRRTFMEDIFMGLSLEQQEWLAEQLGPHIPIKDFVKNLLVQEYIAQKAA